MISSGERAADAELGQHGIEAVAHDHRIVLEAAIELCRLAHMIVEIDLEHPTMERAVVLALGSIVVSPKVHDRCAAEDFACCGSKPDLFGFCDR